MFMEGHFIASVTPQGLSVLYAFRWEERVSVSQMLLGGDVIAVRQEPLVLVLKVAEHVIAILLVLWTISVMRRQGSANAEQTPMVENVTSVNLGSGTSPIVNAVSATDMLMDVTLELVPVPIVEIGHLVTTVIGVSKAIMEILV
jgi:hypothetical protein